MNLKKYNATILIPQVRSIMASDLKEAERRFKSAVGVDADGRPLKNKPMITQIVEATPDSIQHPPLFQPAA